MNRRERKKEETRTNIIECAMKFFKDKGFAGTSMEEIAEKSDVSKGTLYNYFQDKESILSAYFQSVIKEYKEKTKLDITNVEGLENKLFKLVEFINDIFNKNLELTTIYFNYRLQNLFITDPLDKTKRSGIEDVISEVIAEAYKKNELRKDVHIEVLVRNLQFLIMSFLIPYLAFNEKTDINENKKQIIDMFLNGAKSN
jgi:AcrR family transcriptional regulator